MTCLLIGLTLFNVLLKLQCILHDKTNVLFWLQTSVHGRGKCGKGINTTYDWITFYKRITLNDLISEGPQSVLENFEKRANIPAVYLAIPLGNGGKTKLGGVFKWRKKRGNKYR